MAKLQKIRFIGARLSTNPDTAVVQHEQGVKGSVNATQTGKLFFVLDYRGTHDRKLMTKSVLVWADDNGKFDSSGDDYNSMLETGDLDFEGTVMTLNKEDHGILPYTVDGKTFDYVTMFIENEPEAVANAVKAFNKQTLNRNNPQPTATNNTVTKQEELEALNKAWELATTPQKKDAIEKQRVVLRAELGITPPVAEEIAEEIAE